MIALFRTEMSKQLRRIRTYVTLGVMSAIPILITVSLKYGGRGERHEGQGDSLFRLARQSGVVVPAAALAVMSGFFLVIVVAVFAGDIVAGEASWGNLRYLLVRPISRRRLLSAKLAVAFVFACVATALIFVVGLAAGVLAFGWHPIDVPLLGIHQSASQLVQHVAVVTAYIAWNMSSVVALGFLVSTMTDVATGGTFAAAGFVFISEILDAIPSLGFLRYGLPTHYLNAWTDFVVVPGNSTGSALSHVHAEMLRGLLVQVPYIAVFCGVAFWWFARKDITS